jgi:hypothetical protein
VSESQIPQHGPLSLPRPPISPWLRYRTLAAADNAVMLVDGAKGIEPQTRKLFQASREEGGVKQSSVLWGGMRGEGRRRAAQWRRNDGCSQTLCLLSLLCTPFILSHSHPHPHSQVARMRKLPIFTVVNKMDRPALNGFEIIEQLETEFGLPAYPVNWPIGSGDRFCGVYHRPTNKVSRRRFQGRGGEGAGWKSCVRGLDEAGGKEDTNFGPVML